MCDACALLAVLILIESFNSKPVLGTRRGAVGSCLKREPCLGGGV